MLKVGYSATIWDSGRSGIGNYIAEQLAVLSKLGEIDLSILEFGGDVLTRESRPTRGSSGDGIVRVLQPIKDIFWHRGDLKKLSRDQDFDVVHVPTIRRLPGVLPCSSVVTVHDLGPVRLASKYGFLRNIYHKVVIPRWLRSIDAIVTPSESTRTDLIELYNASAERIRVVPNGIDHATYNVGDIEESRDFVRRARSMEAPYFIYISRLEHPAKNHVRLFEAFGEFKRATGLPHQLVCVGGDWNGSEIVHEAAANNEFARDIQLTGYAAKESLPHLLRAAEALVYPSLFEGFGLPVIEAMACGTPVVCSRSSSLTEIAEGRALLFDPTDTGEMSESLVRVAEDNGLRSEMRQVGLAHAKRFTWERSVNETVDVWKQVANR